MLERVVKLVVERPAQSQAVPQPIKRHPVEQVLQRTRDWLFELGERRRPLRTALDDGQLRDLVGDRRRNLHRAGPVADEHDALAGKIESFVGIAGGVDAGTTETVHAGHVGKVRFVESADPADQDGRAQHLAVALRGDGLDVPGTVRLVVARFDRLDPKADMRLDLVTARDLAQISVDLAAVGEVA